MRWSFLAFLVLSCGQSEPKEMGTSTLGDCEVVGPDVAPIRKLTQTEYGNTVRDLSGLDIAPESRLLKDPEVHGFDNNAQLISVSQLQADGYMRASEDLTAALDISDLLPCDPASGEDACAELFIDRFGAQAFRRPLDEVERGIFVDLFGPTRDLEGFDMGISLVIQAMLQSPQFLYRPEFGVDGPGDWVPLTDYELASRLSFMLSETTPDQALYDAAAAGQLSNPEVLVVQIERMLGDSRARAMMAHFATQWTDIGEVENAVKDGMTYPEWDVDLGRAMRSETDRFVADVVFDGDGTLAALFTAPYLWNGDERYGLLTQPSLLTALSHSNQTSIVLRGKFVRERVMCQLLQAPPDDLDISLPPLDESLSTRERFARHMQDPVCSGCHALTDPLGLGFEHYGPLGEWRDEETPGVPVDASGLVVSAGALDGTFYGLDELSELLANGELIEQCFVLNVFRRGFGREPGDADACAVAGLEAGFANSGGDIQSLLREIPMTETFRSRPRVTP
ncbi:MAG: DUF1592 domain-containing protein [Rhodobacterales bacterium]|nr:DUF1592 domain-containing protein [Rhodobacterales bacterium]